MKLFAAVLCLTLVVSNEAFIADTFKGLIDTVKDKILPGLIQTGLTTLITSVAGKRDADLDSLALLEDMVVDEDEKTASIKTFLQKLAEARKAGNVQEFLKNHAKEMREKYLARLTPEQRKKHEERLKQMKEAREKMANRFAAYKKKQEACQAKVKAAREAALKTADKTDGSRRDLMKLYFECMKAEEKKTQEDFRMRGLTDAEKKEWRQKFEEAKKAGEMKKFFEAYKKLMAEKKKARDAKKLACQKKVEEAKQAAKQANTKFDKKTAKKMMKSCMRPPRPTTTVMPNTTPMRNTTAMPNNTTTRPNTTATQNDFRRMSKTEREEFMKKLEEAKKAGKAKEFLAKYHAEQRKKMEEARKAYMAKRLECQKKVEEAKKAATDASKFNARREYMNCMMTEEQKKMMEQKKKCYEEAKAKKAEAEKAKTSFTRMDFYKAVRACMTSA